jgi:ferric-dicitrate binding protein FerR (iron transport regulator)
MEYQKFSADDFIKDDRFQQWVFSPDETTNLFWDDFLRAHPDKQSAIREAREFLLLFHFRENDVFESRIANLKKRIDAEIDQPEVTSPRTTILSTAESYSKKRRFNWYAAASVLIVLSISAAYLNQHFFQQLFSFSTREEITSKGQRTFITLEDGTKIWLNADSKLSYPKTFAESKTREIQLQGEAYFDVAENKQKPFIVHTSDIRIKVLGTSFNVKSYGKDKTIETTLIKGKVTIESAVDTNGLILLPNQQAVFEKKSKRIFLEDQDEIVDYTAWRDGQLVFRDRPLSDIINELERWFNVTIEVDDRESLHCHFSAKVNSKTLPEVLELFKDSESISYTIQGSRVLIHGKLCNE